MTKKEFDDRIKEIFEEAGVLVKDACEIEASSLQYIMVVTTIEEEFGIELPDEFLAFSAVQNMQEFIDRVYELVSEKR